MGIFSRNENCEQAPKSMFGKKNKKNHDNNGVLWAMFIIIATAVSFFVVIEISQKKSSEEIFLSDSSDMTATTKGAIQEALDVSVMIAPID